MSQDIRKGTNQFTSQNKKQEMSGDGADRRRIEQDLWPLHRRLLAQKALDVEDGEHIPLSDGEAETFARRETEREIAERLKFYEMTDPSQTRPTPKPQHNYVDIDI